MGTEGGSMMEGTDEFIVRIRNAVHDSRIEPMDLEAPVRLVEVDFQSDPDDALGRTLELRAALLRQENQDDRGA